MADGSSNKELANETAEALLKAIKTAAPGADSRGTESLESLAKAYAAVVEAMPGAARTGRVVAG